MRQKLQAIDEDAGHHDIGAARFFLGHSVADQTHMPRMQTAHRGHKSRSAEGCERSAQLGNGVANLHGEKTSVQR